MKFSSILSFLFISLFFSTVQAQDKAATEFSIDYEKFTLENGLEVILHVDKSEPIVAVATMMHVGSNREKPGKTGFAHFFEHMSFNDSENVPVGANRKMIPEWGGSRNGGTWSDGTVYYEVVPKDAFEKILWIDSDRFGYMINTVTQAALDREKQVVKNEKRQRVDNAPYGYTDEIIRKNLYPEGHPYSWTVIGSLPDLQAATLEDVTEFYNKYYGAANASLVIAGDIDIDKTKELVKKWFGEIPRGPKVDALNPMPVTLNETKSLYFKDNFAKLPELRMVYPTVEGYNKDEYALDVLGQLLSGSRKSPLYKSVVEEGKLAPNVSSYNSSSELAGEFVIRARANEGVDLDKVKKAIEKGLQDFETNGFTDTELQRIKAELETQLYYGVATVLNKAFQLVQDNEFGGDPGYISKRTKLYQQINRADVMRVYNQYIKGKNFVMTSVVPKDSPNLAVSGAKEASVWEEKVTAMDASEEVAQGEEAEYEKTPSKYDRSEPAFGEAPLFVMPEVWQTKLGNEMKVLGIENNELPLVTFTITFPGGHRLDPENKAGLAMLTADLMNEGTKTKTAAELEEAIGLLGSSISIRGGLEEINVSGNCLSRNFEETIKLVQEMLLEPRWDEKEYDRLKQELITSLKGNEANPRAIASLNFNKLIYGEGNSYAVSSEGTLETADNISLADAKEFYKNISPNGATFKVVGNIKEQRVTDALSSLSEKWKGEKVTIPSEDISENNPARPAGGSEGNLYFIDVPNSKQSVIYIGLPALSANNDAYTKLDFANEILGGGSSGRLFQTLRIEKGYTYGAYSYIPSRDETAPFTITSSVRANATLPSLKIIENMVKDYGPGFTKEDVELTQNKVIKQNTRAYESLNAKLGLLTQIDKYGKSEDFINKEQDLLMKMNVEDFKNIINKYIKEGEMTYVVVGDKATQFEEVKKLGKNVIELDIHGNPVK
ncbi:M16 family metallopeptidase [Marixanthomonas ophiurae]|uniref:Insulinase family protein n=1 Tax=Marixanthomonas ophiurae TaxID=387659 RepID=A0A3E1Q7I4_9FLAO|nr:pitrilysin family protein [Marixanthomonas ophiurae]RFN58082.1 insulinase family protein [Marixanthomonas ophiurae]